MTRIENVFLNKQKSWCEIFSLLKDVNPNPTLKRQEEKEQLSVG